MIKLEQYRDNWLAEKMDEVIGFPLDRRPYDYNELINKFFNVIIDHLNQIKKIVDDWYKENNE